MKAFCGLAASFAFADSWNVLDGERACGPVARELQADVCIVVGGSGGVGAAVAAAREGVRAVLVERLNVRAQYPSEELFATALRQE